MIVSKFGLGLPLGLFYFLGCTSNKTKSYNQTNLWKANQSETITNPMKKKKLWRKNREKTLTCVPASKTMEWKDIYYKYITNNWNWSRGRVKKKGRERAGGKVTDSVYISNPKGQKEAKLKSEGKLTTLKLKNLKGCISANLSKRKDRKSNSNGCEIS